jgi:hypothetical protein
VSKEAIFSILKGVDKKAVLCYLIMFFSGENRGILKPFCADWEAFLLFS